MGEPWEVRDVRSISGGYQDLNPVQFADREREQRLVRERVEEAQRGEVESPLVEFYGVVGQGKSWLLSYLAVRYWFSNGAPLPPDVPRHLRSGYKPTFSAKVDFQQLRDSSCSEPRYVLDSLISQIGDQLRDVHPGLEMPPSPLRDDAPSLDEAASSFAAFVNGQLNRYVPVLAFDATDRAEEDLLNWIEDSIVQPIIRTGRAVFVVGGRLWHRWKRHEVRSRVARIELSPLDCEKDQVEGTTDLLKKLDATDVDALARRLYDLAFGHPLATKVIFRELLERLDILPPDINAHTLSEHEVEVEEIVRRRVIEARFFDELGTYDYLRPLLWAVCILRRFNPTPLRRFTVSFIDDEYELQPGGFYMDAIRDMQATTLVQWSSAVGGYRLDPVVRKIMSKNLAMREPGEFHRRHKAAVELYNDWLRRFPRNAAGFLIERTYHQWWTLRDDKDEREVGRILVSEFCALLTDVEKHRDVQWDLPDIAVELEEELDKDFELAAVLPSSAFERLQGRAREFRRASGGTWD